MDDDELIVALIDRLDGIPGIVDPDVSTCRDEDGTHVTVTFTLADNDETTHLLRSPANAKNLADSLREAHAGEVVSDDQVRAESDAALDAGYAAIAADPEYQRESAALRARRNRRRPTWEDEEEADQ
jgi:hypothetical protein